MSQTESRKRGRGNNLPSCIVGRAPEGYFKRQSLPVENNIEDDEHRIEMRMKQIRYGKNTVGYDRYIAAVPKNKRGKYSEHPRTPDVYERVPKRVFDGRVKAWRRALHQWDDKETSATVENQSPKIESKEPVESKESVPTSVNDSMSDDDVL